VLEAVKGERTAAEPASRHGLHPMMTSRWKEALIESASEVFERGRREEPVAGEATVEELHAMIAGWARARGRENRLRRARRSHAASPAHISRNVPAYELQREEELKELTIGSRIGRHGGWFGQPCSLGAGRAASAFAKRCPEEAKDNPTGQERDPVILLSRTLKGRDYERGCKDNQSAPADCADSRFVASDQVQEASGNEWAHNAERRRQGGCFKPVMATFDTVGFRDVASQAPKTLAESIASDRIRQFAKHVNWIVRRDDKRR